MLQDYERSAELLENRISELMERRMHIPPYSTDYIELNERIYRLERMLDDLYQTIREIKRK